VDDAGTIALGSAMVKEGRKLEEIGRDTLKTGVEKGNSPDADKIMRQESNRFLPD